MTEHDRALLKVGAIAGISGALIAGVLNVLHPRPGPYYYHHDMRFLLNHVHDSAIWIPVHAFAVFGILLILGSFFVFIRTLTGAVSAALGQIGLWAATVGAAMYCATFAVDGIALKQIATTYANATDTLGAFHAGEAVEAVAWGLFAVSDLTFVGAVPLIFGLAVLLDPVYPPIFGWLAILGGAGGMTAGMIASFHGTSKLLYIFFLPGTALLVIWVIAIGVRMWRSANVPPHRIRLDETRATP